MQIYISADIEGTCGIADWSETERKTMDDYRPFQQQMTREVAAACAGAVAAGAEDILLKDAHDTARNIDPTALPRGAKTAGKSAVFRFCFAQSTSSENTNNVASGWAAFTAAAARA